MKKLITPLGLAMIEKNTHQHACGSTQRTGTSSMFRRIVVALSLLSALGLSFSASAACVYRAAGSTRGGGPIVNGPFHFRFAPFTVNIDPRVAVGTLLATQTVSLSQIYDNDGNRLTQGQLDCGTTYLDSMLYDTTSGPLAVPPEIYSTGIPGVGLRLSMPNYPKAYPKFDPFVPNSQWTYINTSASLKFEFFKIGPIDAGGVIDGKVGHWVTGGPNVEWVVIGPSSPIIVIPKIPTCSVSTADVAVPLSSAQVSDFAAVGSTQKEKDFTVSLACSGGDPGTQIGMYMSLADATTPGNVSDTLTPATGNTAGGVGVQILRNGTPINFNSATNQFKVQDVLQGITGTVNVPFKARYIRTGAMSPGSVEAIATFTMDYR